MSTQTPPPTWCRQHRNRKTAVETRGGKASVNPMNIVIHLSKRRCVSAEQGSEGGGKLRARTYAQRDLQTNASQMQCAGRRGTVPGVATHFVANDD